MEEGKGIFASDSTDVETDRYSYEIRPVKSKRKSAKITVKQYLTWHVTPAIIDHLIILNIHVLQARKLMILQYAEQNSIC
ncbi:MAG: hypothetical protein WCF03_11715 [Nitrososphaeraceae archaeon]